MTIATTTTAWLGDDRVRLQIIMVGVRVTLQGVVPIEHKNNGWYRSYIASSSGAAPAQQDPASTAAQYCMVHGAPPLVDR